MTPEQFKLKEREGLIELQYAADCGVCSGLGWPDLRGMPKLRTMSREDLETGLARAIHEVLRGNGYDEYIYVEWVHWVDAFQATLAWMDEQARATEKMET